MFSLASLAALATAAPAAPPATELDFEALEISATAPAPVKLIASATPDGSPAACGALLDAGLPTLPALGELGHARGRRALAAADRALRSLDAADESLALAKARTCFVWTYGSGPRSSVGLYAWVVRQAGLDYCRVRVADFDTAVYGRPTAFDASTVTNDLCLVDPRGGRVRRNRYEVVQTALSEARLGAYLPGGAADVLYREVSRRVDVDRAELLEVLRAIDASGAPGEGYLAGEGDLWTDREVVRAAVDRIASR